MHSKENQTTSQRTVSSKLIWRRSKGNFISMAVFLNLERILILLKEMVKVRVNYVMQLRERMVNKIYRMKMKFIRVLQARIVL